MGHEFIGIVEELGSRSAASRPATWSSHRSCGRTTPATSARPGCRSPAATAAAGANPAWTRARAKPCGCRWPTPPVRCRRDSALMPSLLTLSDVYCTGHHGAVTAGVRPAAPSPWSGTAPSGCAACSRRSGSARNRLS